MSKAVLVIDMPETCSECNLCDNDGYCVTNEYSAVNLIWRRAISILEELTKENEHDGE